MNSELSLLHTVGIYLAAGESRRMGTSKLDLPLGDRPLGRWALEAAISSRLSRIVVVCNQESVPWLSFLSDHEEKDRVEITVCPVATQGQAESLKHGLRFLQAHEDSFMILLADQPFLKTDIVNRLLNVFNKLRQDETIDFVASSFQGIARPPVVFQRHLIQELLQLEGDAGARKILQQNRFSHGRYLDFDQEAFSFLDVDTPEDYQRVLQELSKRN